MVQAEQGRARHRRDVDHVDYGGASLVMENDVDAAALAERALGHGREVDNFAFAHIGTGIGMGLVLGGQLLRGAHGVAGEIAFMPLSDGCLASGTELAWGRVMIVLPTPSPDGARPS